MNRPPSFDQLWDLHERTKLRGLVCTFVGHLWNGGTIEYRVTKRSEDLLHVDWRHPKRGQFALPIHPGEMVSKIFQLAQQDFCFVYAWEVIPGDEPLREGTAEGTDVIQ